MAVSLRDISELTSVNICSVSQVLNGHPRAQSLRVETREKILAAAKSLGYCRNELAASVARRRGTVLGFVSGVMGGVEYTGRIQNGVLNAASERGYTVTVHHLGADSAEEVTRKLIGWRVAGVIFHVPRLSYIQSITKELACHSVIWGTVNLSNPGGIGVTTDDAGGIAEAVARLKAFGHRKICFFANMLHALYDQTEYQVRREEGFVRGISAHYPDQKAFVYHIDDSHLIQDDGYMRELATSFIRNGVDAVICESDVFASALSRGALSAGYSLPDSLSIVGFGNSIYAEASYPRLTTIAQNFEKMGEGTVHFVTDAIEKKHGNNPWNVLLPVEFVERESIKINRATGS
ncbi:MAG: LacI family DNA-binding transcriptional regulator [Lentisphaeria bacterium]